VLRVVLPAVLTGVVFILALFLILIPFLERQLLEGKKETAQELTRVAVSILDEHFSEEQAGSLSREEAQAEAAAQIGLLRYGDDGKDYFWITDMTPTMVVHPYLPELDGQDLSDYEDLRGKRMFVAFVDAVREQESGFVDYYWQWKDDAERVVPKISYVEAFRPWQWVVGTGIYVEDVQQEIARVERRLLQTSVVIAGLIALLLFYGTRQSLKIEKRRAVAEQELRESNEKYLTLVEAATEGILMALEGKCAYSNDPLLEMLGYTHEELAGIEVARLFVTETAEDRAAFAALEDVGEGEAPTAPFEARLRGRDGRAVEVLLAATPITLAGRSGFILIARSLGGQKAMEAALEETRRRFSVMADTISLGVFRSTWGRKPALVDANPAMRSILGLPPGADLIGVDWLERIIDADERGALIARLNKDRSVEDYHLGLRREDGTRADVSLFAMLIEGEGGRPLHCDGLLEDITERRKGEKEREALIAQLQTSLFFLQEPITHAVTPAVTVDRNQSISRAAALMTKKRAGAVFVTDSDGAVMGIATDHDFRERVVANGLDNESPVRAIMTAPVASIPAEALVYEALLRTQESQVDHLAVLDEAGTLTGVVRLLDLVDYQQSSSVIITDSIRRAASIDDIVEAHERLPGLVRAVVDSGAQVRYVNRIITSVSDATVRRLVAMALEQLGPAPVRYAFLALGSEGREEQTLLTDQDNALLYEDPPPEKAKETAQYFLALGELVCDWLHEVGYAFCDGGVMAKNPRWNLALSVWREQFADWIHNADPQALLELNMLFDFRCVEGEQELARELRTWVFDQMESYPLFFVHFAKNALLYKPQLGFTGSIQVTSSGDGPKALSLKEALLPVTNFSRLYALKHRVDSTNTLDRLAELHERGVLRHETFEQVAPDYEALMRLRLGRQAVALQEGRAPSNLISPQEWTSAEEARLKHLFSVTADLRKKMGYDFLGGLEGL
jgi:PAS domain S-box-containing protein